MNTVEALVGDHLGIEKVVVPRAGRLREWASRKPRPRIVNQLRVVAYESFKKSLIIHKEKPKENNV